MKKITGITIMLCVAIGLIVSSCGPSASERTDLRPNDSIKKIITSSDSNNSIVNKKLDVTSAQTEVKTGDTTQHINVNALKGRLIRKNR
ncbi:MAG: hypothetical protein HXX13_07695 [Bacteroidetes bacterium]|nr:hypothetical protein [Bacteroidota bacterium]